MSSPSLPPTRRAGSRPPAPFSPDDAAAFAAHGNRIGVVLCHGFTGMPGSLRPWGEALAQQGFTVRIPLLPGHGTRWQDGNTVLWQDWYGALEDAVDEVLTRCDSVFVMGLSMGGTLTIRLAELREDLAGIVLVNPSLFTTRKDAKLLPLVRHFIPAMPPVGNDIKKAGVTEPAYSKVPVKGAYQLSQLWKYANADLGQITAPMLVLTSRDDHVVEPANSERLMAQAGSTDKRQIWLEDSFHVATLDNDLPLIIEESLSFIRAHSTATTAQ